MSSADAVAFYQIRADYYRRQAAQVDDPRRANLVAQLARIFAERAEQLRHAAA